MAPIHEEKNSQQKNTPSGATIGELVAKVTAQFSALIRDEISMAKLNAKAKIAKLGIGGVLLVVAAVISLYMFGILLIAAGFGIGAALGGNMWLGFLIVAGILLFIMLMLILAGVAKLKASQKHSVTPGRGIAQDVAAIKKGIQSE